MLGHPPGALNATEVALRFPKRVRRLILNRPFPVTGGAAKFIAGGDKAWSGAPKARRLAPAGSWEPGCGCGVEPGPRLSDAHHRRGYQTLGLYLGHDVAIDDHVAALKRITHRR